MFTVERIENFRPLALALAPELAHVPFYLLMQPNELPTPFNTAAYACQGRNVALRDHLRARRKWKGSYGPTIIFVDVPQDDREFNGLCLHELGHVLPAFAPPDIEPTAAQRAAQEISVLAWAKADPTPELQIVPWDGHGSRWIRRVLHLHYRALWQGVVVPLEWLNCAGPLYGLSPVRHYLSALGSEPYDLRNLPFDEIQRVPPPAAFSELFASDVTTYNRKQLEKKQ